MATRRWWIALLIVLGVCSPLVHARSILTDTSFTFDSDPDSPLHGLSGKFTDADSTFEMVGNNHGFVLSVTPPNSFAWTIVMRAPPGASLNPGYYPNIELPDARHGRSPSLDLSGICSQAWGSYTIEQIKFDDAKQIKRLDASFKIRCGAGEDYPAVRGVVHYKAPPMSFDFTSDLGDPLGGGRSVNYTGSTSRFSLKGTNSRVQYQASGNREDWFMVIDPPIGQPLRPGTYPIAREHSRTEAGLFIAGGHGACDVPSGWLTINSFTIGPDVQVTSMAATMEVHCDGKEPAFRATILHNNL